MSLIQISSSNRSPHYPTLKTVLMIEAEIKNAKGPAITVPELKRSLPRKVNAYTLKTVLEYLEANGRIAVSLRGISWAQKDAGSQEQVPESAHDAKSVLKRIKENRSSLDRYGVKEIGLFGSYARGEGKEGSDIDILVGFMPGMKTFDNYMELKFFLEKLLGRKVDLMIREAVKPEISKEIFGSAIYVT